MKYTLDYFTRTSNIPFSTFKSVKTPSLKLNKFDRLLKNISSLPRFFNTEKSIEEAVTTLTPPVISEWANPTTEIPETIVTKTTVNEPSIYEIPASSTFVSRSVIPEAIIPEPMLALESNMTLYFTLPLSTNNRNYSQAEFVDMMDQAYQNAGVKNKELRMILTAQDAGESNWGKHKYSKYYNFGNIHSTKDWKGLKVSGSDNHSDGTRYNVPFRAYKTVDEYAKDKIKLLLGKRYNIDLKNDNAASFIDKIVKGGYAESKDYKQLLESWYKSVNNKKAEQKK